LPARSTPIVPRSSTSSGDEWVDVSYKELADKVKHVALGLVDLGIQPGDKVSILSNTRPEWTYACFGILALPPRVSRSTNQFARECHYVLHHSESRAVFVEDAEAAREDPPRRVELPELELIVVMEPNGDIGDAIAMDDLCARGSRRHGLRLRGAARRRRRRRHVPLHLHLRHHRPAEGLPAHARQLPARHETWSSRTA
jgi:long-chain acyl-CoA synthetase